MNKYTQIKSNPLFLREIYLVVLTSLAIYKFQSDIKNVLEYFNIGSKTYYINGSERKILYN